MTNTNKKNKNTRKLLGAIGMLSVSAAMLVSSTFAWFTMNKDVTAKTMQVKATAEQGIVIAAYTGPNTTAPADAAFADEADVAVTGINGDTVASLIPTYTSTKVDESASGADASGLFWYHAASKKSNNGQDYTSAGYSKVTNGEAVGSDTNYYYLMNKFQIKSPGGAQAVYVKSITVTRNTDDEIDPSIRVLVKTGDAKLIFAPVGTHTGSEGILATTSTTDAVTTDESFTFTTVNTTGAKVLNDVAMTAEDVEIYVYYDGEDAACKSDNITNFADKVIDVVFTTDEANLTDATPAP